MLVFLSFLKGKHTPTRWLQLPKGFCLTQKIEKEVNATQCKHFQRDARCGWLGGCVCTLIFDSQRSMPAGGLEYRSLFSYSSIVAYVHALIIGLYYAYIHIRVVVHVLFIMMCIVIGGISSLVYFNNNIFSISIICLKKIFCLLDLFFF